VEINFPKLGAFKMLIIVEESETTANRFEMTSDQISIGRSIDNNIQLANRFISRRHAVIYKKGDDYLIRDGDLFGSRSKFGVWVNRVRVCREVILRHEDIITFAQNTSFPVLTIRRRSASEEETTSQL
jgi:pSer/pThr/pTyr-binding forkhead associated (FHA) protein